jgi:hypothetical protein
MYYDDLLPAVEAHVSSVTDDLIIYAIGYAARKFFKDSEVWCSPLDFIVPANENVNQFEIEPFEESVVHIVKGVYLDGCELTAAGFSKIKLMQETKGTPTMFHKNGNNLYIAPTPNNSFTLDLLGVSIPTLDAIQVVNEDYMNKYSDAIVFLAISYILGMSGKPWYDLQNSKVNMARYAGELLIARRDALGYLEGHSNSMDYSGSNGTKNSDY